MAHLVKCFYCGETFDADVVPFVKPNKTRYAHQECPNMKENSSPLPPVFTAAPPPPTPGIPESELKDYTALRDYINELFDGNVNWATTVGKMKQFRAQQYTYSGMLKALKWWYEIKKHSIKEAKTPLGIIPFIYNDAFDYYKAIFDAEQKNEQLKMTEKVVEFYIDPPSIKPMLKTRLFDLDREVTIEEDEK